MSKGFDKIIQYFSKQGTVYAQKIYAWAEPQVRPALTVFWKYAQVELIPPTPAEIPEITTRIQNLIRGFRESKWRQTSVRDAWLNSLVTAENLGEGVKHQAEEVGKKLWRIFIEYADNTKQVIEIFQIVKVHLKRKGNTFNLEGQLIQPDG